MTTRGANISRTRRFKSMLRHTRLVTVAGLLLCAGVAAVAFHYLSQPTTLRFAVSPSNPEDARVVHAITAQLGRERASVRVRTIVKDGGPSAAAVAIDNGEADLAIVRRDVGMPRDGQVVAILRKNVAVFIVPAPASEPAAEKKPDVEKIEDLVGKRLGVIGRAQSNIDLLKVVLRQYNIASDMVVVLNSDAETKANAPDKISVVQFDPAGSISTQIRESNVNAVLSVGPVNSPVTADAISALTREKEPPTFLKIGAAEAIAERHPVYDANEIKAGAFGGSPPRPEASVETIAVHHYLVAGRKLGEDIVAEFTKQLFNTRQGLATELTYAAKIEAPDTDKDAAVQVHPGAAAYIDGETKTFFERYSDFIYLGVMIVSFFGSGLAGLVTYSRSGDRTRRLQVLEKLLDVTKAAHTAETTRRLDELQAQTDRIVTDMVRDVEGNALDEAALTAFSIALDQARYVLSDRRAALMGQPSRIRPAVASV